MNLFKRKPPVWQWDDRFSIHVHFISGAAFVYKHSYIIPFDHYAHLIAGSWYLMLDSTGTPRQVRVHCYRGERFLYAPVYGRSQAANSTITEHFGLVGFPTTALVAPNAIINQMIPNCYLYPGDRITIEMINPQGTDFFLAIHFTFKFWNV